jgi:hypothetical protein
MAPHSIGILTIVMVVLAWIHDQRNLTLARGAFFIELGPFNIRIVGLLERFDHLAGAPFLTIQ